MLDDDKFEAAVKELIIDICEVMYKKGYDLVPIGAVMRLVGVPSERAEKHDQEYFPLDEDFEKMLAAKHNPPKKKNSSGITLH